MAYCEECDCYHTRGLHLPRWEGRIDHHQDEWSALYRTRARTSQHAARKLLERWARENAGDSVDGHTIAVRMVGKNEIVRYKCAEIREIAAIDPQAPKRR